MCVQTVELVDEASGLRRCTGAEQLVGTGQILFVEDEAFVRDVTCEVLRDAGYHVLTAKNAVEARQAYDQDGGGVELLLTDVVLPGENGRTLAEKLRRESPRLKVLFVTGYAEQMKASAGECEDLLAKPFSTGMLLRKVRHLLGREEEQLARED